MKFFFKNIFPTKQITYTTHLSKEEVLDRIKNEITPKYLHQSDTERFSGKIKGDTFLLRKAIVNPNSFLAVISGVITTGGNVCTITITIRLPLFIRVVIGIWLVTLSYTVLSGFIASITAKINVLFFITILSVFTLFILLLKHRLQKRFNKEVDGADMDLRQLLEAK